MTRKGKERLDESDNMTTHYPDPLSSYSSQFTSISCWATRLPQVCQEKGRGAGSPRRKYVLALGNLFTNPCNFRALRPRVYLCRLSVCSRVGSNFMKMSETMSATVRATGNNARATVPCGGTGTAGGRLALTDPDCMLFLRVCDMTASLSCTHVWFQSCFRR
jgi:hypothetical protein